MLHDETVSYEIIHKIHLFGNILKNRPIPYALKYWTIIIG